MLCSIVLRTLKDLTSELEKCKRMALELGTPTREFWQDPSSPSQSNYIKAIVLSNLACVTKSVELLCIGSSITILLIYDLKSSVYVCSRDKKTPHNSVKKIRGVKGLGKHFIYLCFDA